VTAGSLDGAGAARRLGDADGSAVVSALVIGLVVATVLATLSARSISESIASRARIDRAHASALAEYGVAAAIQELGAGLAVELRRSGPPGGIMVPLTLDVDPPQEGGDSGLEVGVVVDAVSGDLLIVSRAVVRRATREMVARVRPRTTSDHLLLTAFEAVDPALFQRPRSTCAVPRGDAARDVTCVDVALSDGVLDGPVHSNDVLDVRDGVTVASMLTTSSLASDGDGVVSPALALTSGQGAADGAPFGLHHETTVDLSRTTAQVAGTTTVTCRFRGPTLIRFDDHVVRVTSPRSVARPDDDALGGAAIGCLGVDRELLSQPTSILLPERVVIEIVRDPVSDCVDHPLGIAQYEDDAREWWCTGGDAFVWGTYRGQRTVLAEDSIQIVWDLAPHDDGPVAALIAGDALGLIAGDSVVLRRPVGPTIRRVAPYGLNLAFAGPDLAPFGAHPLDAPTLSAVTWDAPRIVASLVALRGSVGIQNPLRGEQHSGPLRIEGSVATRFRGLFAWEDRTATGALRGAMGYPLELRYDPNLLEIAPPGMPLTTGGGEVRILSLEAGPDRR